MKLICNQSLEILGHETLNHFVVSNQALKLSVEERRVRFLLSFLEAPPHEAARGLTHL